MVRYSKLPFRILCREWGADACFTPMIIAESFNRSQKARDSEFATNAKDRPLIAQFGSSSAVELAEAAAKVEGYVDAIDINCGCPQNWAMKEGLGAVLSDKPEVVNQMIAQIRQRSTLPVSIKIRIQEDLRRTVDLVQQAEAAGVSWITVHGRTARERREPVHYDAIRQIKQVAKVPIFANGDLFSPDDCDRVAKETGVDGVMCARGILSNPAMFAGYSEVPLKCVQRYLELAVDYGGLYSLHHHHLMYMLFGHISRAERHEFSHLRSMAAVVDYFRIRGWGPSYPAGEYSPSAIISTLFQ